MGDDKTCSGIFYNNLIGKFVFFIWLIVIHYIEKNNGYILGGDLCLKRKKFEICFRMKKK